MADDASRVNKGERVSGESDAPRAVHALNEVRTIGIHPSWVIVLTGMCAALHVAKIPPALPVLQAELGLTLLQAGFLLSAVQVASMTLGLLVGLSVDGLGLKRSMLFGLGLLFAASALGGFAQQADVLLLLRALEGLGFLCVVMACTVGDPSHRVARTTQRPYGMVGHLHAYWQCTGFVGGAAVCRVVGVACVVVVALGHHLSHIFLGACGSA